MKYDPLKILLLAFLPLVLRTALYLAACKIRSIQIKLTSAIVIAGSGVFLSIVPIPLPIDLAKVLAIGVAMFLMTRYTEAEVFPDIVLIPLVVELFSSFFTDIVLSSLA